MHISDIGLGALTAAQKARIAKAKPANRAALRAKMQANNAARAAAKKARRQANRLARQQRKAAKKLANQPASADSESSGGGIWPVVIGGAALWFLS